MVPTGTQGFFLTLNEPWHDFTWYVELHWEEDDFRSQNYFLGKQQICIPKEKDLILQYYLGR